MIKKAVVAVRFKFFENIDSSEGVNPLDGVVSFFNGINTIKKQVEKSHKDHEIVYQGGETVSAIPDYASVDFHIKSDTIEDLDLLSEKVKDCAMEAALATGTQLEIENYGHSFEGL